MRQEREIKLAAKLYRVRDCARYLWGEQYYTRIEKYIEVIKRRMRDKNIPELEAVIELVKEYQNIGGECVAYMAAAVEMIEPSIREVIVTDNRKLAINQGE